MISSLHKLNPGTKSKGFLGFMLAAYVLFAFAPFLLLHSHSDEDHRGSHVETTHAHAWEFWAVLENHVLHHGDDRDLLHDEEHDEEHDEDHHMEKSRDSDAHQAFHQASHQPSHQDDVAEGHEGMDFPDAALASTHPGVAYFHAPPILYMERVVPLPKSALRRLPNQVPIPSHSYPDDAASLLTCDLPPPYLS